MNQPVTNPTQAENSEIDILTEKPVEFSLPKKSLLRFFGKPERTFKLYLPTYGTLIRLCKEYIKLDWDEQQLSANPTAEVKHLVLDNAEVCARIVAIAILRDKWKIRWFTGLLTEYFLWRLTSERVLQIANLILLRANLPDFMHSIRLMSARRRVTQPALMDPKSPTASEVPTDRSAPSAPTSAGALTT